MSQAWPANSATPVQALSYDAGVLSVALAATDATWLDQVKSAAAARGLAITGTPDDKGKGIRLNVKPTAKEDHHGQ